MIKSYTQMHGADKYSQFSSIIRSVCPNGWVFVYELSGCAFEYRCSHLKLDISVFSNKEFLDIHVSIKCGLTLKSVRALIRTYSQMQRRDKYSQLLSIIWWAGPKDWVFVNELSGCRFESPCSHFNFIYRACFEHGLPLHSGKYRLRIHSETCTGHDKNIQSNAS